MGLTIITAFEGTDKPILKILSEFTVVHRPLPDDRPDSALQLGLEGQAFQVRRDDYSLLDLFLKAKNSTRGLALER